MTTHKKLIAGNWKMNGSLAANEALVTALRQELAANAPACDIALCAPAPYFAQLQSLLAGSPMAPRRTFPRRRRAPSRASSRRRC